MCWTSKVPLFPPIFPHPYHLKNLHPVAEAHSWTTWRAMAQGRNWEILWKWRPLQRSWARRGVGHGFSRILVLNVNDPSLQLQEGRILLGSVKGNMGHLNTAAGESRVVGILKKIFQNVRWKLFSLVLYHSRLSLSLSSFQECRVLWSQRLSQI